MSEKNNPVAGNEATPMPPACTNGQLYTIKSGDTLAQIARRNNIPLQALISANPQIANPNLIFPGQVICIPAGGGVPGTQCPANAVIYRVVAGDTLYSIATRNGITLNTLLQANPQITNPNLIYPGQVVCIPRGGGGTPACVNGRPYTVVAGDTMYDIARRNNMTLAVLLAANPQVTDPDLIFPGQVICIPQTAAIGVPVVPPVMPPVMPPVVPPVMPPVMPPVVPPVMPPVMPPVVPPVTPPVCMPVIPPVMPPVPPVTPLPYPPVQPPCHVGHGEMPGCYQPIPVWMQVNWEECPYRCKTKKHHKKHHNDHRCK